MYTEDEAKEKGCPISMAAFEKGSAYCNGSLCMAWRWGVKDGDPRVVGYCGLAGKP